MDMLTLVSAALAFMPFGSAQERFNQLFYPPTLRQCLSNDALAGNVQVNGWNNPAYLRGDFNADGNVDYATKVTVRESFSDAILICHSGGGYVVLVPDAAGINTIPIQSLGENFYLSWNNWQVRSDEYVSEELSFIDDGVGTVVPSVEEHAGDALIFYFHASWTLLYWTGNEYAYAYVSYGE